MNNVYGMYIPNRGLSCLSVKKGDIGDKVSQNNLNFKENISLDFFEVVPFDYQNSFYGKLITYKRIKTEELSRDFLMRTFALVITTSRHLVLETPEFLISQYEMKPPLYISKKNGRIYSSLGLGYKKGLIEHQASILITILNKFNLVEDLHFRNCHLAGGKDKKSSAPIRKP